MWFFSSHQEDIHIQHSAIFLCSSSNGSTSTRTFGFSLPVCHSHLACSLLFVACFVSSFTTNHGHLLAAVLNLQWARSHIINPPLISWLQMLYSLGYICLHLFHNVMMSSSSIDALWTHQSLITWPILFCHQQSILDPMAWMLLMATSTVCLPWVWWSSESICVLWEDWFWKSIESDGAEEDLPVRSYCKFKMRMSLVSLDFKESRIQQLTKPIGSAIPQHAPPLEEWNHCPVFSVFSLLQQLFSCWHGQHCLRNTCWCCKCHGKAHWVIRSSVIVIESLQSVAQDVTTGFGEATSAAH